MIRLKCGGSLGEAENTEAREGDERAEQEVSNKGQMYGGSLSILGDSDAIFAFYNDWCSTSEKLQPP